MISLSGILQLFLLPVKLLWCMIKYPIFGGIEGIYKNNLRNSLKLTLFQSGMKFSVEDSAYLTAKSTQDVIDKLKPKYPKSTNLQNYGCKFDKQSIWLVEAEDRDKANPIIIYCHGGGYFMNTAPDQIESMLSIYHLLEDRVRKRTSILVLDYSLACHGHYIGTQLYELAATYKKLTTEGNDNLILFGDSAGGHLVITFLQYLKQEQDVKLPWPRSTILISPSNPANILISPGNLPYRKSDWKDIPTFNNKNFSTFVLLGEHETMRDEILEWAKYALNSPLKKQPDSKGVLDLKLHEYRSGGVDEAYVEVIVEPWGIHDAVLFFEIDLIKTLEKNPRLSLDKLSDTKYFGMVRVTKFLGKDCTGRVKVQEEDKLDQ
ncbi:hypothetical protein I9W82_004040 [Candida metapsilosis]|uniref:Uncharacterized protein n=1 Tax=Candida metapsilosis TaxID=273372 RepID=A0A8H7ZAY9_9ASCO|nr:hypothetical protein I9W82_004040 [Candida metapsilosis]